MMEIPSQKYAFRVRLFAFIEGPQKRLLYKEYVCQTAI